MSDTERCYDCAGFTDCLFRSATDGGTRLPYGVYDSCLIARTHTLHGVCVYCKISEYSVRFI